MCAISNYLMNDNDLVVVKEKVILWMNVLGNCIFSVFLIIICRMNRKRIVTAEMKYVWI